MITYSGLSFWLTRWSSDFSYLLWLVILESSFIVFDHYRISLLVITSCFLLWSVFTSHLRYLLNVDFIALLWLSFLFFVHLHLSLPLLASPFCPCLFMPLFAFPCLPLPFHAFPYYQLCSVPTFAIHAICTLLSSFPYQHLSSRSEFWSQALLLRLSAPLCVQGWRLHATPYVWIHESGKAAFLLEAQGHPTCRSEQQVWRTHLWKPKNSTILDMACCSEHKESTLVDQGCRYNVHTANWTTRTVPMQV